MSSLSHYYPAGHLLSVDHGVFQHVGVSDGHGGVYENSYTGGGRGRISLGRFAGARTIQDLGPVPGGLPSHVVVDRARRLVRDPRRYHMLRNNCEHFIHEVGGTKSGSAQVRQLALFAASTAISFTPAGRAYKAAAWTVAVGSWLYKRSTRNTRANRYARARSRRRYR